ncbi:hypothetical protein, partial [Pseudomonas aeruginosa]|uniref:hypothetical protein n=1 Tax=Pseudomonas aeruginosa TaxID=287 RepID=UPI00404502CE
RGLFIVTPQPPPFGSRCVFQGGYRRFHESNFTPESIQGGIYETSANCALRSLLMRSLVVEKGVKEL